MKVKICGITSEGDALAAVELGATHIGFVFHEASPRCVTIAIAAQISQRLPKGITKVGVFVNQRVDVVQSTMRAAGLDVAQLHGDETPEVCRASAQRFWKALRANPGCDRDAMLADAVTFTGCECVLVDAKADLRLGGTGQLSDWQLATALGTKVNVVLAGGLNASNVADAIKAVRPWGVDVSSGVEARPGIKDKDKMAALFAAIQRVDKPHIAAERT